MTVVAYPHFSAFDLLFREMDQATRQAAPAPGRNAHWQPAVDVWEETERLVLRADLPGMTREAITVKVEQGRLLLTGKRREESPHEQALHHEERPTGAFRRVFQLPKSADVTAIRASYRHGVLEVVIPKIPRAVGRTVPVEYLQ